MAQLDRIEALRDRRLETFVYSPIWRYFQRGCWRRYLQVRAVTQRDEDGRFRGGYADIITWHWTAPCETEEEARRALFPALEAFAIARKARESAEARAFIAEEKAAAGCASPVPLETVAKWRADMVAMIKEDDLLSPAPPLDFPPLPKDAGGRPKF